MKSRLSVWKVLKIAACILGGIVSASVLFLGTTLIVSGFDDGLARIQFIQQWIPFVWFSGAVLGGGIAYRSEQKLIVEQSPPTALVK